MSSKKKIVSAVKVSRKPRTEAQKIARRERDRKRREMLKNGSKNPSVRTPITHYIHAGDIIKFVDSTPGRILRLASLLISSVMNEIVSSVINEK